MAPTRDFNQLFLCVFPIWAQTRCCSSEPTLYCRKPVFWSCPFQETALALVPLSSNIKLRESRHCHLQIFSILKQNQTTPPQLAPGPAGADLLQRKRGQQALAAGRAPVGDAATECPSSGQGQAPAPSHQPGWAHFKQPNCKKNTRQLRRSNSRVVEVCPGDKTQNLLPVPVK